MTRLMVLEKDRITDPAARMVGEILSAFFGLPAGRNFAVRYPLDSVEEPLEEARFTLILRWSGVLRRMLLPPTELTLGEAYLRDSFDVEGDLEATTGLVDTIATPLWPSAVSLRLFDLLRRLPADDLSADEAGRSVSRLFARRHSRKRHAAAVRYNYDAGNDFYALWLAARGSGRGAGWKEDEMIHQPIGGSG